MLTTHYFKGNNLNYNLMYVPTLSQLGLRSRTRLPYSQHCITPPGLTMSSHSKYPALSAPYYTIAH